MAFGNGSDTIEIRVQVDNTGAVKLLGQTEEAVKGVGKAAEKTNDGLSTFSKGMIALTAAAGATYIAVNKVVDAVERGSRVDDISNAFERLAAQAGISADVLRGDFSNALGGTISQVDVMKRSNELLIAGLDPTTFDEVAQAARSLADATGRELAPTLDLVSDALVRGNDRALKQLGVQVDLKKANEEYAQSIGTTSDKLTEAQQVEVARVAMLESLKQKTRELGIVTNDGADNLAVMSNAVTNFKDELSKAIATSPELNKLLTNLANFAKNTDFTPIINGISGTVDQIARLINYLPSIENFTDSISVLTNILSGVPASMAVSVTAQQKYLDATKKQAEAERDRLIELTKGIRADDEKAKKDKEVAKVVAAWGEEEKKLQAALNRSTGATSGSAKATKDFAKEVQDADAQVVAYKKHLEELANLSPADKVKQNFNDILGGLGLGSTSGIVSSLGIGEDTLDQLGLALGDAVFDGVANGFNRDGLRDLASEAGGILGAEFGIPFGDQIAGFYFDAISKIGTSKRDSVFGAIDTIFPGIGTGLDSLIGDSLFGDSAATTARKQADKFFAELFNGLDLTFSGNQDPTKGLFAGLGAQAQAEYQIAGDALTQFMGLSTEQGINLGVVLANNNITLGELSMRLQELGIGFDQLSSAMYTDFYEGELSALDLQNRLEELMGVIDGSRAFEDLGAAVDAAFSADGRALLAALKGIGQQAQATGVTLGQMPDILTNKFGVAADRVQQLMAAMAAAGIKSVADLANAANPVLVALAANVSQASQGIQPDNKPVTAAATTTAPSGGSSPSNSGSRSSRTKTDPKEKMRRELEQLYNLVDRSGPAKELQQKISLGLINDGEYAAGIQSLMDQAKKLQDKVDKEKKEYLNATGKARVQQLKEFEKAKGDLENLLKDAIKPTSINVNGGFLSFAKEFANNIGLMEKAAKAAGVAFKGMKDQALDAFLSGAKTFSEAKQALFDAGPGIAGKQGAVGEQLTKLLGLGENGGLFSVEALKGLASEAKELGATTLDGLFEGLNGQGVANDQQQALSIALTNAGVTSLDALESIGSEVAINVLDIMKQSGAAFGKTSSEIKRIANDITNIPASKTVQINLENVTDPAFMALLQSFNLIPDSFKPTASTPYSNTSPGLKAGSKKEYNKFIKAGKLKKAENYKATHSLL